MLERTEKQVLQRNLIDFIIHDVFNGITYDEILKIKSKDVWECKGRTLEKGEVASLKQEAQVLREMKIWKDYLRADLMWNAQRILVNKSKVEEDLLFGKVMLYVVSVIDARLRSMETGKEEHSIL